MEKINVYIFFSVFIFLFTLPLNIIAQVERDKAIEKSIQTIFSGQNTSDIAYADFYELMIERYYNPLDLNKVTYDELASLCILSEDQLVKFFKYREHYGSFISVYELQVVDGFDLDIIHQLTSFCTVQDDFFSKNNHTSHQSQNYVLIKHERLLEYKRGFIENKYIGSPDRLAGRLRVGNTQKIATGFCFEKDAGEKLAIHPSIHQYGADFYSYYISINRYKQNRIKKIIIGDYRMQTGQGLVLGMGFGLRKGSEVITSIQKRNEFSRANTSMMESGFFRGATFSFYWKNLTIHPFFSIVSQDGSVTADSTTYNDTPISSIYYSGLHRTSAELSAKHRFYDRSFGVTINYESKKPSIQIGFNFLKTVFTMPLQKNQTVYNQFDFQGLSNQIYSFYYSFSWKSARFFGELAQSQSKGHGSVAGVIASLGPKIDFSLLYRFYQSAFHSFYGNGFGEKSGTQNEKGIYMGSKITFTKKMVITAYADVFHFPWIRYGQSAPDGGYDLFCKGSYQFSKRWEFFLHYRSAYQFGSSTQREDYTGQMVYTPDRTWTSTWRLQYSHYFKNAHLYATGFMMMQDIEWRRRQTGWAFRFSLFDASNDMVRQYVYEQDVLYSFSFPSFMDRGARMYFIFNWKITSSIQCWFRVGRTWYTKLDHIGSGSEEIDGNTQTEISTQIKIDF